ncbi:MAG: hypothetical protein H6582_03645 [Crocinitomicaceae bacterium]|nr:hypothetical protein [Crocinitomicaceae bacterium]
MVKSDQFISDRIIWRAEQHEFPYETAFLYSKLPESEKQIYDQLAHSNEIGIPVLFFKANGHKWTILGTRKVISGTMDNYVTIDYSQIEDTNPGGIPFPSDDEDTDDEIDKEALNELGVKEFNGKESSLCTMNGPEFYMLYNILLVLMNMSREN